VCGSFLPMARCIDARNYQRLKITRGGAIAPWCGGRGGTVDASGLKPVAPSGALLITPPLNIEKDSGSSLRVLALIPG
jgi:hypothetical protein